MAVGDRFKTETKFTGEQKKTNINDCVVVARMEKTVNAGTFDTFQVDCDVTNPGAGSTGVSQRWWDVKSGQQVYGELTAAGASKPLRSTELVEVKLQPR